MQSVSPASDSAVSAPSKRGTIKRAIAAILVLTGAAALFHIGWRGGHVDERVYTAEDLQGGPRSQIVRWDSLNTAVQLSRLSDLPPDDLWKVVTDQGRFDEFMPYVTETTIEPGSDGALLEKQILDLPFGDFDLVLEIRLKEQGNVRTARWSQTSGFLRFNEGEWVVERLADRNDAAILRYRVAAKVTGVPQWLSNFSMRRRLGKLLVAVEERVRTLQQTEPEYFSKASAGVVDSASSSVSATSLPTTVASAPASRPAPVEGPTP